MPRPVRSSSSRRTTTAHPPGHRRRRLALALWRHRHLAAALALGLATALAVDELRPPPPALVEVVVAADDLTAAQELAPGDVRIVRLPAGDVPAGAARSTSDVVGARLAHAVPAGFPLAASMTIGPGLADGAPPGTSVVPVRLADPSVASLLEPGSRMDLVEAGTDGGAARTLASDAVVIARIDAAGGGLTGLTGASAPDAPLLLVAVRRDAATLVVEASARATLSVVLAPPP